MPAGSPADSSAGRLSGCGPANWMLAASWWQPTALLLSLICWPAVEAERASGV